MQVLSAFKLVKDVNIKIYLPFNNIIITFFRYWLHNCASKHSYIIFGIIKGLKNRAGEKLKE